MERVWSCQIKCLHDCNVVLEGILLKPNMVTPGQNHPEREGFSAKTIAARTLCALLRTVPPAIQGIMFLSGGQSEGEATNNLNEMNKNPAKRPWNLSFSYGRALQNTCIKTWAGSDDNLKAAQDALLVRMKANSQATKGEYVSENDKDAGESLVVENYVY